MSNPGDKLSRLYKTKSALSFGQSSAQVTGVGMENFNSSNSFKSGCVNLKDKCKPPTQSSRRYKLISIPMPSPSSSDTEACTSVNSIGRSFKYVPNIPHESSVERIVVVPSINAIQSTVPSGFGATTNEDKFFVKPSKNLFGGSGDTPASKHNGFLNLNMSSTIVPSSANNSNLFSQATPSSTNFSSFKTIPTTGFGTGSNLGTLTSSVNGLTISPIALTESEIPTKPNPTMINSPTFNDITAKKQARILVAEQLDIFRRTQQAWKLLQDSEQSNQKVVAIRVKLNALRLDWAVFQANHKSLIGIRAIIGEKDKSGANLCPYFELNLYNKCFGIFRRSQGLMEALLDTLDTRQPKISKNAEQNGAAIGCIRKNKNTEVVLPPDSAKQSDVHFNNKRKSFIENLRKLRSRINEILRHLQTSEDEIKNWDFVIDFAIAKLDFATRQEWILSIKGSGEHVTLALLERFLEVRIRNLEGLVNVSTSQ